MNDQSNKHVISSGIGRIARLSVFDVKLEAPNATTASIYANGRMQVKVEVLIQAVDVQGNPVEIGYFPDLLSVQLINYYTGQALRQDAYSGAPLQGWNSATQSTPYRHERPGAAVASAALQGVRAQRLVFWVSSSIVESMRIGAQITLSAGVYRTNKTLTPTGEVFDESVTIQAVPSERYHHDLFVQHTEAVDGYESVYRRYFSLVVGGRRVRLLKWMRRNNTVVENSPVLIAAVNQSKSNTLEADIVPTHLRNFRGYGLGGRPIVVNERDGDFMFLYRSANGQLNPREIVQKPFFFDVVDEYGSVHPLSLQYDPARQNFILRNG